MSQTTILWFRQDLRLADNPALQHALAQGHAIIPVYIWDPAGETPWPRGGATQWWLHHSLAALAQALEQRGNRLRLFSGDSETILTELVQNTQADAVLWNRRYEPHIIARDSRIKAQLKKCWGLQVQSFNAALWWEPWELQTAAKQPYRVFTPMWKRMLANWRQSEPLAAPDQLITPLATTQVLANELSLSGLNLLPQHDWAGEFPQQALVGELAALTRLQGFILQHAAAYQERRDFPAEDASSRLSAHLHFGEISPQQVIAACCPAGHPPSDSGVMAYVREIAWREFSYHLLYNYPHTPELPLMERFERFPWKVRYREELRQWQRGQTGIPFVDAGMRQLWRSGWMHNRVRMLVASFLSKNLLIPWQEGARWFWDTLVDADLANNTQGWQWTAGCGADAAPFFRIFNPVSQGQKFDPDGAYIQRWVPELAQLPVRYRHAPWQAPSDVLRDSGVKLGVNYPEPIVDLKRSREKALAAYAQTKLGCSE